MTFSSNSHSSVISKIFSIVMNETGIDLRHYKIPTVRRRMGRRMARLKINSLEKYLTLLENNKEEVKNLKQESLIRVTSFFRDPRVFDVLCRKVFLPMMKARAPDDTIRIWVPGCSSGEEVFSIAIALHRCFQSAGKSLPFHIFGTDLDETALEKARAGLYAAKDLAGVPEAVRTEFFTKADRGFHINKNVRSLCSFAKQDLTQDPPFSKMDLISCRNVLIYINPESQNRIFSFFHYGLKPSGFLLLGKSEAVGAAFPALFGLTDKKSNLYRKKFSATRPLMAFPAIHSSTPEKRLIESGQVAINQRETTFEREVDSALLHVLNPSMLLLNEAMEVVQVRGDVSDYLHYPTGKTTFELSKIAKDGFFMEVKLAINAAENGSRVIQRRGIVIKKGQKTFLMDLEVRPLMRPLFKERYFMVLLTEHDGKTPLDRRSASERPLSRPERTQFAALKEELKSTQAYLQSIIRDNDRTNQDLRTANEEILSNNEELQSLNEELHTAKEELESTNEELSVVNDELENRNSRLSTSLEKLHRYQLDLQDAQTLAHMGSWTWDIARNEIQWSDELYRIYGLQKDDGPLSYEKYLLTQHPQDRERVAGLIREALTTGGAFEFEHRIIRPDQSVRMLHAHGQIIRDGAGTPLRMYGTAQDRTELKTIENKLRLSELRFRLLVEEVQDYAIYALDPKGIITTWNTGAERMKGFSADEIINQHYSVFFTEADRRRGLPESVLKQAEQQGRFVGTGWRLRKDGSSFWGSIVLTALKDKNGELFGFSKITRDMTEAKKAEDALLEARSNLERRVEERTQELSSANRELEQFAYVASHDLQEPLRKVSNFSDLLVAKLGPQADPAIASYLDKVLDGVGRMDRLINDLLSFSRLTKESSAFTDVDAAAEVRLAIDNLKPSPDAEITIDPLPRVPGRALQIRQVFQNLIGNAIKFRSREPLRIRIGASQDSGKWVFSVRDNGIGIDPQYGQRIFVLFQRLNSREDYPGTGIGLALCKKIVESHGGEIWCDSKLGEGATFYFTLGKETDAAHG